jgi:hypothetical protein
MITARKSLPEDALITVNTRPNLSPLGSNIFEPAAPFQNAHDEDDEGDASCAAQIGWPYWDPLTELLTLIALSYKFCCKFKKKRNGIIIAIIKTIANILLRL